MRRSTDRLYPRSLDRGRAFAPDSIGLRPFSARETEALLIVTERPGITVAELRDTLGVGKTRIWQVVSRLEVELVRRERNGDSN
jgi:uncharacterized membrane protein